MKWTTKLPTEDGFYWTRQKGANKKWGSHCISEVDVWNGKVSDTICGSDESQRWEERKEWLQWYGPLEPPT